MEQPEDFGPLPQNNSSESDDEVGRLLKTKILDLNEFSIARRRKLLFENGKLHV